MVESASPPAARVARAPHAAAGRDGRSTRWDPHRRERRTAIIEAAVEAIEQFGPDALTAQIAAKAGVPRTHVYRHFDGKPALDLAVSTYVSNQIGEQIRAGLATRGSARDVIRASVDKHLGWIEAHPNLYRFLAANAYAITGRDGAAPTDAKAAFARELTTLIRGYAAALGARLEPPPRVIVGVVALVDATAAWWVDRPDLPRPELTAELTEQVWLLLERSARQLGLSLTPDQQLPAL
ncbi:TetR/AcrR family transcriptional regulator [uncultured Jatrophihabitans sp.]|uniref:TetR/AcrR family transcriptional regulator n=1 Tax=uncultured Jatrophihabitans sp. TaxID=1610747 RepID=UPI0035CAACF7